MSKGQGMNKKPSSRTSKIVSTAISSISGGGCETFTQAVPLEMEIAGSQSKPKGVENDHPQKRKKTKAVIVMPSINSPRVAAQDSPFNFPAAIHKGSVP